MSNLLTIKLIEDGAGTTQESRYGFTAADSYAEYSHYPATSWDAFSQLFPSIESILTHLADQPEFERLDECYAVIDGKIVMSDECRAYTHIEIEGAELLEQNELDWNDQDPFYKARPHLVGFNTAEMSVLSILHGYYSRHYPKADNAPEAKADRLTALYVEEHQRLMRESPIADPFFIKVTVDGQDEPTLWTLLIDDYFYNNVHLASITHEKSHEYRELLLASLDRTPYMVTTKGTDWEENAKLVLGLSQAKSLRLHWQKLLKERRGYSSAIIITELNNKLPL